MKMNDENFINQLKKKNEKALDYVIQKYGWLIKTIVSKHYFLLKTIRRNVSMMYYWQSGKILINMTAKSAHFKIGYPE